MKNDCNNCQLLQLIKQLELAQKKHEDIVIGFYDLTKKENLLRGVIYN